MLLLDLGNETLYVNAIQFIFMDRKYNSSYRNDTYFYRYSISSVKEFKKIAQYIVSSPLYYITYILLIVGFIIELILTQPSTEFLAKINQQYSEVSYNSAIIIFIITNHCTNKLTFIERKVTRRA